MQVADKTVRMDHIIYQYGKSDKSEKYIQTFSNIVVKCLFPK